nr:immunoglobulin light chain junction region [Macaca mulatta]MOV99264.1 immunoglobulin light chain junction region [Macaca mulatta]
EYHCASWDSNGTIF